MADKPIPRTPQFRAILSVAVLALLLLLCSRFTIATAGVGLPTCIAPGAGPITTQLATPGRFDCTSPQTRFGPGTFWVRAGSIPADHRRGPLRVRAVTVWQKHVRLYAAYADGRVLAFDENRDAAGRSQFSSSTEFVLPGRPAQLDTLFWHVEQTPNLRGILVYPQLMTPDESRANALQTTALYLAFFGLCVGLLVFNVALWIAVRSRFQLAYCAMLVTLGLYALSAWGAMEGAIPASVPNANLRFGLLLLAMNGVAGLWFTRHFFEPRVLEGWVDRAIVVVMALVAFTGIAMAALAPWQMAKLDAIHGATFGLQLLLIGPILWRAWRRHSMFGWMFMLVWTAPAIVDWMRFLNTFHLMSKPLVMRSGAVLLLAIEALASAIAIAHRIHLIGRERDEARAQEIVARTLADIDPLTNLLNRRAFLDRAIGRPGEQTLLLADIDHFKNVNDTIGHDGGDEVLRVFARALRAAVPADALVSRFGGEEFAIIINADADLAASSILDRLRAERMPFDLRVTASIGTCVGPLALERDWKTLYRNADRALFEAKASGRDRARAAAMPARAA